MSDINIRRADAADTGRLADTLAEAFDGDPVWAWMLPDAHRNRRIVFHAILKHSIPKGHVYTTDDCRAVTMWAPPEQWKLPVSAMLGAALPMLRAAGTRLRRLLGRNGELEKLHEKVPRDHWYLEFIGTSAAAQGAGLGSALMRHGFDHVTLAKPIYLESSNPRNLTFYKRHGFEITGQPAMRSGPPQWTLWRD